MKKIILSAFFAIGISFFASAQSKADTSKSKSLSTNKSKINKAKGKKVLNKKEPLNPRKTYHWSNGQRATPSGNAASPTNGGYVSLKKDTVGLKKDSIPPKPLQKN